MIRIIKAQAWVISSGMTLNITTWSRTARIDLFNTMIPGFNNKETGRFQDGRM